MELEKEFASILETMTKTFPELSNLLADIKILREIIEKTKENSAL